MRLALDLGYLSGRQKPVDFLDLTVEAERLGYSCVWVAEAYGSDAPTLLAWLAGRTSRIDLGAAVMQIPARAPAMTAMTAATLDAVSGGRFRLGLGVSGPQVSEGWYGVPFARPLARTREYVEVVRLALAREPVSYAGEHHRLPLPGGAGKALRLAVQPVRAEIPLYLAAIGPNNLRLAGEIADGWLGVFCSPDHLAGQLAPIAEGRAAAGRGGLAGFDVTACVPVVIGDDVAACADLVRPYTALYVGGMGSRERNFYHDLVARMGYPEAADAVREAYLAGRHRDAAAALPLSLLDDTALLGPVDRVAAGLRRYAEAGVGTLAAICLGDADTGRHTLVRLAEAYARSGVGGAAPVGMPADD